MLSGSMRTDPSSLTTVEFAALARSIASTARQLGLAAPGFRCPTRILGVDRTMRRFSGDEVAGIVAVNVKDRPLAAVVADMIEGVVMLNQLQPTHAAQVRGALWNSLEHTSADTRHGNDHPTTAHVA
ncbi:MAG: hypothetical protein LW596_04400 [Ilumatobacteraceae bacterium]|jgi:hypothetical protein|nr:hypothetical protein [Ilumatobacteraceae bacterium]